MRLFNQKFFLISAIAFVLGGLGTGVVSVFAQIEPTERAEKTEKIELGFSGHVKLGHWSSISFPLNELASKSKEFRFEVECDDSNGTRIKYAGALSVDPEFPKLGQGWFRLGRNQGQLTFRLLDKSDQIIRQTDFEIGSNGITVHPSTQQATLVVESGAGTHEKIASSLSDTGSEFVVSVSDFSDLPNNALMYEGVDHIYLSLNNANQLKLLSTTKLAAITEWVKSGGRLVVSGGPNSLSFLANSELAGELCPGQIDGVSEIESSSRLTFFTNGTTSLIGENDSPMKIAKVLPNDAITILEQDEHPLIIRAAHGLGQLTFVALDMDDSRFQDWPESVNFVSRLFRSTRLMTSQSQTQGEAGGRVSHYGYEDMTGQLRVPLDQFTNVKFISFTWVAVLIGLFILCIGPGDYFLLRKMVGKMEMTWITFSLMAIVFCGIAYFGNRSAKPNDVQINQLEIVDVDVENNRIRSSLWSNVFGPRTESVSLSIKSQNPVGCEPDSRQLTWQGLPGKGLGGMQSKTVADFGSEAYESSIELSPNGIFPGVEIQKMPFQVSSSKSLFGQWHAQTPFQFRSRLKYDSVSEQIQGTVTNPLDLELRNCRIYFDNWVYVFDQPFLAGETVDLLTETSEKNIKSFMTRRQTKENKGANTRWDPTDTDVSRIANMLMFYEAAGGASYTNLTHRYQSFIDMTDLLTLNRAILVGEARELVTEIGIEGSATLSHYDQHTTLFRFVIPIENVKRGRSLKP